MSHPTSTIDSTITTTLVIFDSQVTDLPLFHKALLPGSIGHTIQPDQDPIDHITHLLTETGATKLAIVAHGQPGVIQIGNGVIDRATLEARSGLLQEWGVKEIALYSCEVGVDKEFIQRLGELTGAEIAASTSKIGAGNWELAGGMVLLEIDRLTNYSSTLATFNGTPGNDSAFASIASLGTFTGGTEAELNDGIGDTFAGGNGDDYVVAGNGDDNIYGENGNDILYGYNGNDTLDGGAGVNILDGGAGNDYINANYMRDTVDGGSGDDFLSISTPSSFLPYSIEFTGANAGKFKINGVQTGTFTGIEQLFFIGSSGNDTINASLANLSVTPAGLGIIGLTIFGDDGNDTVLGSAGSDFISGNDGDDGLYGQGGNDTIDGGPGFDVIYGQAGIDTIRGGDLNDFIFGGTENDIIDGDDGQDFLYGDDGNDNIYGGYGFDIIYGLAGNDTIYGEGLTFDAGIDTTVAPASGVGINDTIFGGIGNDEINGGIGNDVLLGEEGNDSISGGDGNDFIYGGIGTDEIRGGAGNDYLVGQDGNDQLNGGAGIDYLEGGNGDDFVFGGDDDDYLYGNAGNDVLDGVDGNDFLDGGDGNDTLRGEAGNDVLFGVEGDDFLAGMEGNDYLYGGNGNDILNGLDGSDFLIGGAGSDKFGYFAMTDAGDTITDFNPLAGGDNIDLTVLFANLPTPVASGNVNASYLRFSQFGTSTAVQVDQDGGGPAGFVTMATLSNVLASSLMQTLNVLV